MTNLLINLLEKLLSIIQTIIQRLASSEPDQGDQEEPVEQNEVSPEVPGDQERNQTVPQNSDESASHRFRKFILGYIPELWKLIKNFWVVFFFAIVLIGVIWLFEHFRLLPRSTRFINARIDTIYHPYTSIIVVIALILFLLFPGLRHPLGYGWKKRNMLRKHPKTSITVVLIVTIIILNLYSGADVWVFNVHEVGAEGLKKDLIAAQFRGNLNAVGDAPLDALVMVDLAPPFAALQFVQESTDFQSKDCDKVMNSLGALQDLGEPPIFLSRPRRATGKEDTGDQNINMDVSVAGVDLPLDPLLKFLPRFSPNRREFIVQVIDDDVEEELEENESGEGKASDLDSIRIVVADDRGNVWSASGPSAHMPQLINFLTLRMVLDLLVEHPRQTFARDEDLARVLGHEAYVRGNYSVALAYYRLAESIEPGDDAVTQRALGLTLYKLEDPTRAEKALRRAMELDDDDEFVKLYVACMIAKSTRGDKEEAFREFNQGMSKLELKRRIDQLRFPKNPPLGPGREISVDIKEDGVFDVYFILGSPIPDTIYYNSTNITKTEKVEPLALDPLYLLWVALNPELNLEDHVPHKLNPEGLIRFDLSDAPQAKKPRQVFAVKDGAFYITGQGTVHFLKPNDNKSLCVKPFIDDLNFIQSTGGIRQIFADDEHLFALARLGQIYRFEYEVPENSCGPETVSIPPRLDPIQIDAKQIFLEGDTLYMLKDDGIWYIPRANNVVLSHEIQLLSAENIREIAVEDRDVYQLLTNGQIWRFQDGINEAIDVGSGTERFLATGNGLYLLKSDGAIWHIKDEAGKEREFERLLEPLHNDSRRKGIAFVNGEGHNNFHQFLVLEDDDKGQRLNLSDGSAIQLAKNHPTWVNIAATNTTEASAVYEFTGVKDQMVTIEMHEDGSGIDSFLTLRGPDGQDLAYDDDGGEGLNSRIVSDPLPANGDYTIIPRALGSTSGAYELSLAKMNALPDETKALPNVLGLDFYVPITDTIEASTVYTFTSKAGRTVMIEMQEDGSGIDTSITLIGPDGQELAYDDDGGEGLNSRILSDPLPADGDYTIVPRAWGNTSGAYWLRLGSGNLERLDFDVPITGTIEDSTIYYFTGKVGQAVIIEMKEYGSGIDSSLMLKGPNGQVIAEDDDGGEGLNSRIVSDPLPADFRYTIIPKAKEITSGAYSVSLAEISLSRLNFNVPITNTIEASKVYTFTGKAEQTVTIEMQEDGSGIDTFLTLLGPDGQVLAEDDDGGEDRNSRISGFVLHEDAIYRIIPKALDRSSGAYKISITDE